MRFRDLDVVNSVRKSVAMAKSLYQLPRSRQATLVVGFRLPWRRRKLL